MVRSRHKQFPLRASLRGDWALGRLEVRMPISTSDGPVALLIVGKGKHGIHLFSLIVTCNTGEMLGLDYITRKEAGA
jgi:hypothetical protein